MIGNFLFTIIRCLLHKRSFVDVHDFNIDVQDFPFCSPKYNTEIQRGFTFETLAISKETHNKLET